VVLSAGGGDLAVDWGLVQPQIAAFTRVCSYDRAGSGWSEPGPVPRTLRQEAFEVEAVLRRMGEPQPVVFVGHSLGGLVGRLVVDLAPHAVAGMVLVDSTHESTRLTVSGKLIRFRERATGRTVPPPQTMTSSPPKMRAGENSRREPSISPPYDRLPPDLQLLRLAAKRHQKPHDAGESYLAEELQQFHEARRTTPRPLDDLPLVVLAGAKNWSTVSGNTSTREMSPEERELQQEKAAEQEDLARLSSNSRFVADPTSGHHIHLENPTLVIRAIREVVDAVRSKKPLAK
jgi:pimeloyl-ACP methyl ester carboxylesterase